MYKRLPGSGTSTKKLQQLAGRAPSRLAGWGKRSIGYNLSSGAKVWTCCRGVPLRALALSFLCTLVLLIAHAAFELGGAGSAALSLSFVPGLLALLALGPALGWAVSGLMLASMAWLFVVRPPLLRYDLLRFIDQSAMVVFAAGLAHALHRSFGWYEMAIARRQAVLLDMQEKRTNIAAAIFEQLDPLSSQLVATLSPPTPDRQAIRTLFSRLIEHLRRAKELARTDETDSPDLQEPDRDQLIRCRTMRVWLRLGAFLMAFFVIRNLVAGTPFLPSVFSLAFCLFFDIWLGSSQCSKYLESTALAIGLSASGPMIAHIHAYGGRADAPPLVVTPGIVLFTALLSQGPATWAVVALNVAVLAWVGLGSETDATGSSRLTDLALSFLVIVVAIRSVFALRRRYALALLEQAQALARALRQHRRLAGTLFHDVSNHLQALSLHLEVESTRADLDHALSLSRRVQRLIRLSKEFLLNPQEGPSPALGAVTLDEAVKLLLEAFAPRLGAKQAQLLAGPGLDLRVRAQPELLIESVLGNLLSNAIKFSPLGAQITLKAERIGRSVRIVICDSGRGIPPEVVKRLGQDCVVPSALGTAGERGQGYGLQLVHEHLQRMGGRLELSNRREGGTEAAVWLETA
ncbi:MAG TPA: HAMP domain-containing sensor histidine kinase [Polyangiaceae bacterium]|nr:HAMP domain-containing sensor histidine kinase [Polyangiaceae bacterium]